MTIANILAADTKPFKMPQANSGLSREYNMLVEAKNDIKQMLTIMKSDRGYFEFQEIQERRIDTLQSTYDSINVV